MLWYRVVDLYSFRSYQGGTINSIQIYTCIYKVFFLSYVLNHNGRLISFKTCISSSVFILDVLTILVSYPQLDPVVCSTNCPALVSYPQLDPVLLNICVTDDHGYVPFITIPSSFSLSSLVTEFATRVHDGCNMWSRKCLPIQRTWVHTRFFGFVLLDLQFSEYWFVHHCLSFCTFSFVHCIVCSSIYGFWLPPFDILDLRLLITHLISLSFSSCPVLIIYILDLMSDFFFFSFWIGFNFHFCLFCFFRIAPLVFHFTEVFFQQLFYLLSVFL